MKSVDKDKNKKKDPAPYYGLSCIWADENGKIQSDYDVWVQNRPNTKIEYYGKCRRWMAKWRKKCKWAGRYGIPQIIEEGDGPELETDELLVEPIEEFDQTLVDDENDNMMPEQIFTKQDLINQNAYYIGFAKHMMKANYRYTHKKWWQWWIKREKFPRYPIERDQVSKDGYGRIFITREIFKKIIKWDQEIERKKKLKLF